MEKLKTKLLTPREYEVLELVAKGYSNPEIADRLFISAYTVKTHLESIFYKLSVHNRIQAVVYAIKNNILVNSEE